MSPAGGDDAAGEVALGAFGDGDRAEDGALDPGGGRLVVFVVLDVAGGVSEGGEVPVPVVARGVVMFGEEVEEVRLRGAHGALLAMRALTRRTTTTTATATTPRPPNPGDGLTTTDTAKTARTRTATVVRARITSHPALPRPRCRQRGGPGRP